MIPSVVAAERTGPYRLRLRFDDAVVGELDLEEEVGDSDCATLPVRFVPSAEETLPPPPQIVQDVPEISRFYGIVVSMYFNDHGKPHFHARYGDADTRPNSWKTGIARERESR